MSQLLINKLAAVRRKHAMVTSLTGAMAAAGGVVLLISATMIFDWWIELPRFARAAMLLVELALLAYIVGWEIIRPIVRGPDDEELALSVERETPDFHSRLISVVQLLRPEQALAGGMSSSMLGALVHETERMAEPMDFTRVIKVDRLATMGTIAAVIIVGFGATVALTAPSSFALAQRAMLMNVPVPRKTIVDADSKDLYIPRGESVTLSAKASGLIIPSGGSVKLQFASGVAQTFDMPRDEGSNDHYSRTVDNVQDDFSYVVTLNDGHGKTYHVTAAIRPAVSNVDCQQKFPDYTGVGTVKRQTGDLSLLEGSRLLLNITANKKLKITSGSEKDHNFIHLQGSELDFPLTVSTADTTRLTIKDDGEPGVALPKGTTGFSVHLVDTEGLTSKNPAVYPITLVPDQLPRVSITSPKRNDELVTSLATVDIGFDASDDYGVKQVLLRYRVIDPDGKGGDASGGDGLKGTYYRGTDFANQLLDRLDGPISFDWSYKNPVAPNLPKGGMSIRWVGQLQAPVSGDFTFFTTSTSKVQAFLDDKPLSETEPVTLKAFQRYDLKIEYISKGIAGPIKLEWQGPGIPRQAVPREVLFSVPVPDKTSLIASGGVPEKIIALQISTAKSVRGYYPWKVSDFASSLPLGSVIQWRLEAVDTNNVTGPGISFSEPLRQLRLVSETDKRKELMDRMGENLSTLTDINDAQRAIQSKTAGLVTGAPVDGSIDVPDQKPPQK